MSFLRKIEQTLDSRLRSVFGGSRDEPGSREGIELYRDALDQIAAGEIVNGRKVVTQRIKHASPPKTCAVLFVSRSEKDVSKLLPGLGPGVLTVGEGETFIRNAGMVAFVLENRRVRFDINQTAAENAGLKLSSKLLSVARSVEK